MQEKRGPPHLRNNRFLSIVFIFISAILRSRHFLRQSIKDIAHTFLIVKANEYAIDAVDS